MTVSVNGPALGLAAEHARSDRFRQRLTAALAVTTHALSRAERPYVAVSGGVDSTAVMALVLAVRGDATLWWSDDELEYPETVDYMAMLRDLAGDQLVIGAGWARHAGWFDPWRSPPFWRDPFPGALTIRRDADDFMAARGHDLTLLGTRADESRKRRDWLLSVKAANGLPLYAVTGGTGLRCCPIWDWSKDDVWALIAHMGLPYNGVYDRLSEALHPFGARSGSEKIWRYRVGPLPLARRADLTAGWPELLARLETRYGPRWS